MTAAHTYRGTERNLEPAYDWRNWAACQYEDADLFYAYDDDTLREALDVCSNCSVRRECLNAALTQPEPWGVWGGLTAADRGYNNDGSKIRRPK